MLKVKVLRPGNLDFRKFVIFKIYYFYMQTNLENDLYYAQGLQSTLVQGQPLGISVNILVENTPGLAKTSCIVRANIYRVYIRLCSPVYITSVLMDVHSITEECQCRKKLKISLLVIACCSSCCRNGPCNNSQ